MSHTADCSLMLITSDDIPADICIQATTPESTLNSIASEITNLWTSNIEISTIILKNNGRIHINQQIWIT